MDHKGGKIVGIFFIMGQNFKELVEKEGEICTMDGRRHLKHFGQIGNCVVLWIPSTTNVFPLLGGDNYGGYGVVCMV
jgi:hypothetical protein